ncbi:hypothetical protein D3C72_1377010 [compost metagenome]
MAVTGTTRVLMSLSVSLVLTNWLGNSAPSALSNRALALTVPVVVSTRLSKVRNAPVASGLLPARSSATTGRRASCFCASRTEGIWSWGTVKLTSMGATLVMTAMPVVPPALT